MNRAARLLAFVLTAQCAACTWLLDPDEFDDGSDFCADTLQFESGDLALCMRDMQSHQEQRFVVRVVSQAGFLQGLAMYDLLPAPQVTLHMRRLLDTRDAHVGMYADANENGGYDPPPVDHAWRFDADPDRPILFAHNTDFTDLGPEPNAVGGALRLDIGGMDAYVDRSMEIRLAVVASNREVGLFHVLWIERPSFEVSLPGLVESDVEYRVDIAVDDDGDTRVDGPNDLTWQLFGIGGAGGLILEFSPG